MLIKLEILEFQFGNWFWEGKLKFSIKRLETIMKNKRLIGVILSILFLLLIYYTSPLINNNFDGALGYMMKSVQRILFFVAELIIFVKLYKKDSIGSIVNMNSFKDVVPACSAMFIYVVFDVITYTVVGAKGWVNTTMPIVVSCLIFMQFATGLVGIDIHCGTDIRVS